MHPDLRLAGTLPSLDMPHHLRRTDWCQYREGISMPHDEKPKSEKLSKKSKQPTAKGVTRVETGLHQAVYVPGQVPIKTRLTFKFKDAHQPTDGSDTELMATAVAPSAPREEAGYYWGYSVRSASSLSAVLTECPFDGGYDLTFGTSERGISLSDWSGSSGDIIPNFHHMMIVFGGVAGLEVAVKADDELGRLGVKTPEALFDHWVNLVPGQGSRTIRTEEALWLGLMGLRDLFLTKGKNEL